MKAAVHSSGEYYILFNAFRFCVWYIYILYVYIHMYIYIYIDVYKPHTGIKCKKWHDSHRVAQIMYGRQIICRCFSPSCCLSRQYMWVSRFTTRRLQWKWNEIVAQTLWLIKRQSKYAKDAKQLSLLLTPPSSHLTPIRSLEFFPTGSQLATMKSERPTLNHVPTDVSGPMTFSSGIHKMTCWLWKSKTLKCISPWALQN